MTDTLVTIILIFIAVILFGMALPIILAGLATVAVLILTPIIWLIEAFTRAVIWPIQRAQTERLDVSRPQVGILQRTHLTPFPTKKQAAAYKEWLSDFSRDKEKKYRINGWKKGRRSSRY